MLILVFNSEFLFSSLEIQNKGRVGGKELDLREAIKHFQNLSLLFSSELFIGHEVLIINLCSVVYLYPVLCYPSDPYVLYSSHEPAVPHFRPENLVNFTQCSKVKGTVLS